MSRAWPPVYLGTGHYPPPIAHRYADYQGILDTFLLHRLGEPVVLADRLQLAQMVPSREIVLREPDSGVIFARRHGLQVLAFTPERMAGYGGRKANRPYADTLGARSLWRPAIAIGKYFRQWGKHLDITWTHDLDALRRPIVPPA